MIFTTPDGLTAAVKEPSRVKFTKGEIGIACLDTGDLLHLEGTGINGRALMWALAERESGLGKNCTPRHEMAYCTGRYANNPQIQALTKRLFHAAHASFGPWQLMMCNAPADAEIEDFADPHKAAGYTVRFLNSVILGAQKARTLEDIADAYNSGNWRDKNVPVDYIAAVKTFYYDVLKPVQA